MTTVRRAALMLAGCLLLGGLPLPAAHAETVDQARAAARRAAARVAALEPSVAAALVAYETTLRGLAESVSVSVGADAEADEAARVAAARRREVHARARALYMSGGTAVLYASVLRASNPADALRRVTYVQRVLRVGNVAATDSAAASAALRAAAERLGAGVGDRVVTASVVQERSDRLSALLAEAADELGALSGRARGLAEAQAAAARLRALSAAASRSGTDRVAGAHAVAVPADYRGLYAAAARTCPGLSWTVLAAVGQVETGHGRNTATSYAGAQGPMQFLPSTFAGYAVDGDGDGRAEISSPADSIFTAARYLCSNGAGRGPVALHRAVWHYNHAEWYVELVLKLAGQLAAR